ncbi:DUF4124 domain-containing protein [Pseudomonas aeruginosa]|nr:DUF4124 domain-containing protein [Pseudomonas aeruginosa]MBG4718168.1 DUF4124 domain-containing protein [Pseudomonas aeruginosa]
MFKYLIVGLGLLPLMAQAQVYKCVSSEGRTTYSQVPCPDASGTSTELRVQTFLGPDLPVAQPGNEQERLQAVAVWAYQRFPFLNIESPDANDAAINEVVVLRDEAIRAGEQPAEALLKAVGQVGPRYSSAEIVRRNSAAADIMQSSPGGGGGLAIVGGERSEGCWVDRFQPVDKQRENSLGTRIPNTNLVNVHTFSSTIRCADVVVSCGGGGSRLVSADRLQAHFSSGTTAHSTTKGNDVRVGGGESVSVSACFGSEDSPISSITVR